MVVSNARRRGVNEEEGGRPASAPLNLPLTSTYIITAPFLNSLTI
jgi:hypothetical protein